MGESKAIEILQVEHRPDDLTSRSVRLNLESFATGAPHLGLYQFLLDWPPQA